MRVRLTAIWAARVAAFVVLTLVVFANSYGHFHTDIKPEVYVSPGRMLTQFGAAWSSTPYLGAANFNVGLVPVLAVTAALRGVGLDPEWTFKVFHLALWVLGASGASALLRELLPRVSPWAAFATGVAFLANPYTITGGSTLAIALPMCLLPWLVLCFLRALRDPRSWAWPAGTGVVLLGMSGMNVAVVPIYQLLMFIPIALVLRRVWSLTWQTIAVVVGKCALFAIGLSLYWLVPSAVAQGTGEQVVSGSETLEGIARVSSFLEVLRGLGMWTLYGRSDAGAWMPQFAAYITVAGVVVITALWPALSLWALRFTPAPLTRIAAISAAVAAVIMVGLFPGEGSSPAGWVLGWIFENVPGLVAFRTTNKIGAVLTLAFALVLGFGAHRAALRLKSVPGGPAVAAGTTFLLVMVWAMPAFAGNLYTSEFDVPEYWQDAADRVNEGPATSRVLMLPGQTRAHYRWSQERPDDLTNSLFTRDAVIPETTASTSAGGANFLNALDDTLQSEAPYPNALSTYARYLGVDQILLRHDTVFEEGGGARPGTTARILAQDPGLFGVANFGEAGRGILPPTIPPEGNEGVLNPVQLYAVEGAEPTVRLKSVDASILIAGDARALPPLARDGLLQQNPLLRYVSDLDPDGGLAEAIDHTDRVALTDSNQRRESVTNRLTSGNGPLLTAEQEPQLTRALGESADQTVLTTGGVEVRASDVGAAFFEMPNASAANAVDGDPRTAWIFGDFRRAIGAELDITLPAAQELGEVTLSQRLRGPVSIRQVTITAGGRSVTADFRGGEEATADLGGVTASEVNVRVDTLDGDGFNLVALSEVDLGIDAVAERSARLPIGIDERYLDLDPAQRRQFAQLPLDVYLSRAINTPALDDDSETTLERSFSLPDDRTYDATARVRLLGDWERQYDAMAGLPSDQRFRSSGVLFNNPDARASRAADGEDQTAWVPAGDLNGAWWQVTGAERNWDEITITQGSGIGADADETRYATRVAVSGDGREIEEFDLGNGRGTHTIALDEPVRGSSLRITVRETTDAADEEAVAVARFTRIDTGVPDSSPARSQAQECMTVATLDGRPLRMRPADDGAAVAVADSDGASWEACGSIDLTWGEHELGSVDGVQLDALTLHDTQTAASAEGVTPPPTSQVEPGLAGAATVSAGASPRPYAVVLGQGYDPRWQATIDGRDLGPPQQLDGYSVGWIIDDPGNANEIVISFGPQRWSTIALLLSGTVLLLAGYLIAMAWWRGREERRKHANDLDHGEVDPSGVGLAAVEPAVRRDPTRASLRALADIGGRSDPLDEDAAVMSRNRWLTAAAVVALAGFAAGWPGVLVAAIAVLLVRWWRLPAARLIDAGAILVVLSAVVFVLGPGDTGGTVSADAISASMWPHWLAGAGLVSAVLGALLRPDHDPDGRDVAGQEPAAHQPDTPTSELGAPATAGASTAKENDARS